MREGDAESDAQSVEKDEAVKAADYERAAELRDKAEQLRRQKEQIQRDRFSGALFLHF